MRRLVRCRRKPRKPGEMNKVEQAYEAYLAERKLLGEVQRYAYEEITLKLADKCRFTPDFNVIGADDTLEFHEVKAGIPSKLKDGTVEIKPLCKDDALVKIKVAAKEFPHFRFCLAYRHKQGPWHVDEVGL